MLILSDLKWNQKLEPRNFHENFDTWFSDLFGHYSQFVTIEHQRWEYVLKVSRTVKSQSPRFTDSSVFETILNAYLQSRRLCRDFINPRRNVWEMRQHLERISARVNKISTKSETLVVSILFMILGVTHSAHSYLIYQ